MSIANLYWIDDSVKHMMPIADNVFPLLWDENISCVSILFGNAYCAKADERGPSQEDCKALSNYIEDKFILYCQDLDKYNWKESGETFKEKKALLFSPAARIIPLEHTDKDNTENTLGKLANKWIDKDNLTAFQAALATMHLEEALDKYGLSVNELIREMDIPDHAPVALDIYLLHGDGTRVQNGLPTVSMALYHTLSLEHPCYLYSEMAVSQERANQWKNIYQTIFSGSSFDIHPKTGLVTMETTTEAKRNLIDTIKCTSEGSK